MGLDGIERRTILHLSPEPQRLDVHRATWEIALEPMEHASLFVTVAFEESEPTPVSNFFIAYRDAHRVRRASTGGAALCSSSSEVFDEVASRSTADAYTLITRTDLGPYPFAGIPWFSTIFGRDGIITAMLMLWMDRIHRERRAEDACRHAGDGFRPEVATPSPARSCTRCAMARWPISARCRSAAITARVDATPLFLMLAGQYFERTGDRETIEAIWPNIEAALDGSTCSVIAMATASSNITARRRAASSTRAGRIPTTRSSMLTARWPPGRSRSARCRATSSPPSAPSPASPSASAARGSRRSCVLKPRAYASQFEQRFWCEEIGTYALALDGAKRPCRVRASNAGHALFTGIASPERARRVAASLMSPERFSGWGIRTVAHGEARYNPMSYHNGSVWPHDNALCGIGFARYGLKAAVAAGVRRPVRRRHAPGAAAAAGALLRL